MSARAGLLVLVALALAPPASAQDEPASARWVLDPSSVEVGEPVVASIEIRHPRGTVPTLTPSRGPELDDSWVLLAERPRLTLPDPERADLALTTFAWELASLEGGERPLPSMLFAVDGGTAEFVAPATLEVVGVLASDEDAPRPPRGFRPLPPEAGTAPARWPWLAGGGLALALAALLAQRYARRRARAGAAELPPLERLQRLTASSSPGPEGVRALHYELSALVRESTDRALGRDRSGLTDDEWLAALRGEDALDEARLRALADLLGRCAPVKYAGASATSWAVEEVVGEARSVLTTAPAGTEEAAR